MSSPGQDEAAAAPESPGTPTSPSEDGNAKEASPRAPATGLTPPRLVSTRSLSEPQSTTTMTSSSTPLGSLNAARRPQPNSAGSSTSTFRSPGPAGGNLPQDMQAKLKAFHLSRQGAPPVNPANKSQGMFSPQLPQSPDRTGSTMSPPSGALMGAPPGQSFQQPVPKWQPNPTQSTARPAPKQGLGARRGLKLPGGLPGSSPSTPGPPGERPGDGEPKRESDNPNSLFNKFSEFVDTKTGTLKFKGKATIHGSGVEFSSGSSFSISLDEVDNLEELGKGNYGTVYKVRHSRPRIRRPGLGLRGNRPTPSFPAPPGAADGGNDKLGDDSGMPSQKGNQTTGIIMGMKEIRLELDEAKFAAIIMELDILHRCVSPFIIDFYGAFFQEGAVYICMEYMDGGSIDKLYGGGVPERILRKVATSTIFGLKSLKEDHNIIHRDVKPTNILVNTRGQIKICDFGVSGNLVASFAKTNIGCQSYMAPERISGGGMGSAGSTPSGTYSVQSDVWSLGLSIVECATGRYPYSPETYNNIFSQLSAIVDGEPPGMPAEGFSEDAHDFVRKCLHKVPKMRPSYALLLNHAWLAELMKPPQENGAVDAEAELRAKETPPNANGFPDTADEEVGKWVIEALERRRNGTMAKSSKPPLHAVPLDAVPSPS